MNENDFATNENKTQNHLEYFLWADPYRKLLILGYSTMFFISFSTVLFWITVHVSCNLSNIEVVSTIHSVFECALYKRWSQREKKSTTRRTQRNETNNCSLLLLLLFFCIIAFGCNIYEITFKLRRISKSFQPTLSIFFRSSTSKLLFYSLDTCKKCNTIFAWIGYEMWLYISYNTFRVTYSRIYFGVIQIFLLPFLSLRLSFVWSGIILMLVLIIFLWLFIYQNDFFFALFQSYSLVHCHFHIFYRACVMTLVQFIL